MPELLQRMRCGTWAIPTAPSDATKEAHRPCPRAVPDVQHDPGRAVRQQWSVTFVERPPLAKACAETEIALSTEQANAFFLGCGMVEQGWALAQEGQADEGVTLIVRGMDVCRSSGAVLEFPHCWASLADAYRGAGRIDEALQAVAEGLKQLRDVGPLQRGRAVSAQGRAAHGGQRTRDRRRGALLPAGHRDRSTPEREVARAASRDELELASSNDRASARTRDACWRRFIPGSPKASTPQT